MKGREGGGGLAKEGKKNVSLRVIIFCVLFPFYQPITV